MKSDLHESLQDIHNNTEALKKQIVDITQYLVSSSASRRWAQNLRFITAGDADFVDESRWIVEEDTWSSDTVSETSDFDDDEEQDCPEEDQDEDEDNYQRMSQSDNSDESVEHCPCVWKRTLTPIQDPITGSPPLYLTRPGELGDCLDYIAVSYRWMSREQRKQEKETYLIDVGSGESPTRPTRAPPSLLKRILSSASAHNYRLFWMDQECIDQTDRTDKESGIQSMDLVYQNAKMILAVLNNRIEEQRHLDALFDAIEGSGDMTEDQVISALEVLELIFTDDWHSRAWCFQESSVPRRSILFLIARHPDLVAPNDGAMEACHIPGEVEIGVFELCHSISGLFAYGSRYPELVPWMEKVQSLTTSTMAVGMVAKWTPSHSHFSRRYRFNAAQAVHFLATKKHSRVADALAMVANLCNYPRRLNTMALEEHESALGTELSLTTCLLALSLSNGDLSFLFGAKDVLSSAPVSSWVPGPAAKLSSIRHLDLVTPVIYRKCEITQRGLSVPGVLWQVDHRVGLETTRSKYLDDWLAIDPTLSYFKVPRPYPPSSDADTERLLFMELHILRDILHHLYIDGFITLAEAFWNELTVARKPLAFGRALLKGAKQRTEVFKDLQWLNIPDELEAETETRFVSLGASQHWITRRCLADGHIFCGYQLNTGIATAAQRVESCVFDVNESSSVLTPVGNASRLNKNRRLHDHVLPISWTIAQQRQAEDGVELSAADLVRGLWTDDAVAKPNDNQIYVIA